VLADSNGEAHTPTSTSPSSTASQAGRPATASTTTQLPMTAVRATVRIPTGLSIADTSL